MRISTTLTGVALAAVMAGLGGVGALAEDAVRFKDGAKKSDILQYLLGPAPGTSGGAETGTTRSLNSTPQVGGTGVMTRGGQLTPERPTAAPTVDPASTGSTQQTAAPASDAKPVCPSNRQFGSDVHFKLGSYYLEPSTFELLGQIAGALTEKDFDGCSFVLEGHTDSTGDYDKNMALSQQRADTVGKFLEAFGIDGSRLVVRGKGSSQPANAANPKDGVNRRVQFRLINREQI